MGPGGIRVALLGPAGQQQLGRLEPADHHRQPLHPRRRIGPREHRRIDRRAPQLTQHLHRCQVDDLVGGWRWKCRSCHQSIEQIS